MSTRSDPRSVERRRHHYEVERELAQRLRRANRDERRRLFPLLYGELFDRVPDHPRLTRRDTPESSRRAVAAQMRLLQSQLSGVQEFLEFAPGDCRLAFEVCRRVRKVHAADISDQTGDKVPRPSNFSLHLYDGYDLDIAPHSIDMAFSYQFLEHLHPEDIRPHFELVHRLLKPRGCYIFATPHRYSGPHDASRGFSEQPEGFHMQEWTYGEMGSLLEQAGFGHWRSFRRGRLQHSAAFHRMILWIEKLGERLPVGMRRRMFGRAFESVSVAAWSNDT